VILKKNYGLVNKKFLDSPQEMPEKPHEDLSSLPSEAPADFVKSYTNFRLTFLPGV